MWYFEDPENQFINRSFVKDRMLFCQQFSYEKQCLITISKIWMHDSLPVVMRCFDEYLFMYNIVAACY